MACPSEHYAADQPTVEGMHLLIVSPVRLLRDGIATILQKKASVRRVETVESVEAAIAILQSFTPKLILLDLANDDGISVARRLTSASTGIKLLGFAARTHDHDVLAYARAGIAGFVPREASTLDLCDAIDLALNDEMLCSPHIAAMLFRHLGGMPASPAGRPEASRLTVREREIAHLIDDGLTNKEIARHLSIEVSTVKNHVHHILEKLSVTRRGKVPKHVRMADSMSVPSTQSRGARVE